MKIIGWIIIFPFLCVFAPFLFMAVCVSEVIESWLGESI